MTTLSVRDAYRLWAPKYADETAMSYLEAITVDTLDLPTTGRRVLDACCGTARRLRASGAAVAVGVDVSVEMLHRAAESMNLAAGDVRALPVAANAFDIVWCRLAIGHVSDVGAAYAELARVCRPGGHVVVSDLSPQAASAGHRRTFKDSQGVTHEVEHYVHSLDDHTSAAQRAGLVLQKRREGIVGSIIREFYAAANRLDAYQAQVGSPLVLALAWRKDA